MYNAVDIENEYIKQYKKLGADRINSSNERAIKTALSRTLNKLQAGAGKYEFEKFVLKNSRTIRGIWREYGKNPAWLKTALINISDFFKHADETPEIPILFFEQEWFTLDDIYNVSYSDNFINQIYDAVIKIKNENIKFELATKIYNPSFNSNKSYPVLFHMIYVESNCYLPQRFLYTEPAAGMPVANAMKYIIEELCREYGFAVLSYYNRYQTYALGKEKEYEKIQGKVWINKNVFGYMTNTYSETASHFCSLNSISRNKDVIKLVYTENGQPIEEYNINLKTKKIKRYFTMTNGINCQIKERRNFYG